MAKPDEAVIIDPNDNVNMSTANDYLIYISGVKAYFEKLNDQRDPADNFSKPLIKSCIKAATNEIEHMIDNQNIYNNDNDLLQQRYNIQKDFFNGMLEPIRKTQNAASCLRVASGTGSYDSGYIKAIKKARKTVLALKKNRKQQISELSTKKSATTSNVFKK